MTALRINQEDALAELERTQEEMILDSTRKQIHELISKQEKTTAEMKIILEKTFTDLKKKLEKTVQKDRDDVKESKNIEDRLNTLESNQKVILKFKDEYENFEKEMEKARIKLKGTLGKKPDETSDESTEKEKNK